MNNVYFLSTEKSDRAPQAILSLSEMLDFVLHSSQKTWVSLAEECKQTENYINLELMRYEDRLSVRKKFEGNLNEHEIAPMMMITLIENAFKHGVSAAYKAWIELSVKAESDIIEIVIKNSISKADAGKGIGLENLRSQLALLYPERHEIRLSKNDQEFSVQLILRR